MAVNINETSNDVVAMNGLAAIGKTMDSQRAFFKSGVTKEVDFRIAQLKKLRKAIVDKEAAILDALKADLNKHKFESYGTEIGFALLEIDDCIKNLKKWAKPKKVKTAMFHFKASSYVISEPYGLTLIIAPWNYPFQLLMVPLIGAMAAGNCVMVKPSELAPNTSRVCADIIRDTFDSHYVAAFEGGVATAQELLRQKFDYIFFTGSTEVGKIVYQAAARNLTPVTLELGGKSPCIVDENIKLDVTAKRIVWGKLVNAGQTCIAPDYLMVHSSVKDELLEEMGKAVKKFYGENPEESKYYGRIINERHFDRIERLMQAGNVVVGGEVNRDTKYISPTIIDGIQPDDPVMQEEIFGPVLPVLEWTNVEEVVNFVNDRPKPLALYVFSKNKAFANQILEETSSGGACVNDTLMHIANPHMSFGGVGESGIGGYHGSHSFDTFSHQKAVMDKSLAIDPPVRYAPYRHSLRFLKFVMSKFA